MSLQIEYPILVVLAFLIGYLFRQHIDDLNKAQARHKPEREPKQDLDFTSATGVGKKLGS